MEEINKEIDSIYEKADMNVQAKRKKVSAYRVFKRETAPQFKHQYPNMKNSERQMIVKEQWRLLGEKEKAVFVYLARLQEERDHYDAKRKFYDQRL